MRGRAIEILGCGPNHAEALARGRLHDPPGAHHLDARRAEFFQPPHFGFNIVGFDVQMHSAGMGHRLYFDMQAMLRTLEFLVDLALVRRRIGAGDL